MELKEIKDLWGQYDEKLDRQVQLNMRLLKKIEFAKTRTALRWMVIGPSLGIVAGVLMQLVLVPFIADHFWSPQFSMPAMGLSLFGLFLAISSIRQLAIIGEINYDGPVAAIQRQVEKLRIHRIRCTTVLAFSWALLWLFVPIVVLKGLYDFDFYAHFDHAWIATNMALGLVVIMLVFRLSRRHLADSVPWPWLRHLLEGIAGHRLAAAKASLKEIEDFARESS